MDDRRKLEEKITQAKAEAEKSGACHRRDMQKHLKKLLRQMKVLEKIEAGKTI